LARAEQTIRGSLWADTARDAAFASAGLDGAFAADVAIVGGGFTGLSAALHLAEAGRPVCILEANTIGWGASGRNGGQVNPGLRFTEPQIVAKLGEAGRGLFRLGEEATDFLADLIERKALHCDFVRPGVIRLAHNRRALLAMQAACRAYSERGVAVRLLEPRAVEAIVGTARYLGGMIDPRGGSVQPLELARELARVAGAAGVVLFEHSPVTSLTPFGQGWKLASPRGTVTAKQVIVATNGYSDRLVPRLAQSLLPVNSFQIATAPLAAALDASILPERHAVFDSRRLILYFRKSPAGHVILGGRASFSSAADGAASDADYDVLAGVLHGIYPQLREVPIVHRWTGLVCITPDFLPHYHNPADGLHVVLGYNGKGVAFANRAGAWIARKLIGVPDSGDIPVTPIKPIPLHRFRAPMANVAMEWHRLMDFLGR
jgi:glycine/D-amino acid oxidase-like deaminating enzyme